MPEEHCNATTRLEPLLTERFGARLPAASQVEGGRTLELLAAHRVSRGFSDRPVPPDLVDLLCACALSAPSKSDLQQRDIVIVEDPSTRNALEGLMPGLRWLPTAPVFLVFCINGRRLPAIAEWRGKPFPNDHFDLLFNGIGDAAIALAWFQIAAESVGLGGCPISEIRNHAAQVGELLKLPERVIPYAGFCLGWPAEEGRLSPRLPLDLTVHRDRYSEDHWKEKVQQYDRRREAIHPMTGQRGTREWGEAEAYGWSEDKARQYAEPLRTGFGAYARARGFSME